MAYVAHHGATFEGLEHVGVADVHVTGGGDQQVDILQQGLVDTRFGAGIDAVDIRRHHFKTVHAGLHCTDRISLGDFNNHAFLAQ